MNMGEKINALRIEKGLTLEELGNMVGVGKSTVRKWETGMIANMKRDKILKVSEALGTSPAYLMGWSEDPNDDLASCPLVNQCRASPTKEAVELFLRLDEVDRGKVIGRMEQMLEDPKYNKKGRSGGMAM